MPRVFISHATADRAFVEREIIALFQRHNIDVWYSRDDISTAEEWGRSILRGLRDCDWFLIVLSHRSLESEWVRSELHWALKNRKGKVVPVLTEDCPVEEFDLRLPRIQSVDYRNPTDNSGKRLLRTWNVEWIPPTTDAPSPPSADHPGFAGIGRAIEPRTPDTPATSSPIPAASPRQFVPPIARLTTPPFLVAPFDAAAARRGQEQWAEYLRKTSDSNTRVEMTNAFGMQFKLIPPGEYLRGSPNSDPDSLDREKPQHRVRITKPFYLGAVSVTQKNWIAIMGTHPWFGKRYSKTGDTRPATFVSWDDAVEFCRKLTANVGRIYRLPTEAEWEYACRAGTATRFSYGDDLERLSDHAWFNGNMSGQKCARMAGEKRANSFGLFDMHGNVGEWCDDGWDSAAYSTHLDNVVEDPKISPEDTSLRASRGGSWFSLGADCRSAGRDGLTFRERSSYLGFRIVSVSSVW